MALEPLPASALRRRCDASRLTFATTDELPDLPESIGQERAVEAVRFGMEIRRYGYNLFALGPSGMGKHGFVRGFLERRAASEPAPSDWCYVSDFADPRRPRALRLPSGRGAPLRRDIEKLIEDLRTAIPAALQSEDVKARRRRLEAEFVERSEGSLASVEREALAKGVLVVRTPLGIGVGPARDGQAMSPDEFHKLPEAEQAALRAEIAKVEAQLEDVAAAIPQQARRQREALRELERQVVSVVAAQLVAEVKTRYADVPTVTTHLDALLRDVVDHVDDFAPKGEEAPPIPLRSLVTRASARYAVNLLVDNGGAQGAPVLYEDHPTLGNLVGRVEHLAEFGSLVTDFRLIRAGDLHRANGGYLIIDARKILQQPLAWDGLKRALRSRQVRVESLAESLGLVPTATLDPEPIPLDVKVVLVGERLLYHLLTAYDPDFLELFKVAADFEEAVPWTPENVPLFARFLGTLARRDGLRPLDRGGVARTLEESARLAEDSQKLSVHAENLADLLREADHAAARAGRRTIAAEDVALAVEAAWRRTARVRDRVQEQIRRGTLLIDTRGAVAGQVNGLSVLSLGPFTCGHPSRITARVRVGSGQVVDIEREVELGGPIHSKGVLILAGFLGARYSPERPLSLQASLVFEQSYAGVEGDSASLAELLVVLSALADVPLRQAIAVTGSVNQLGRVQPVGGVNDKIEGFFDTCRARGLTGAEGVVIPTANVANLMLRPDVVEAVAHGLFRVWPVETVDEAIEILTGVPAGARDAQQRFPEASVNQRVEARLAAFAEQARAHARAAGPPEGGRP